MNDLTDWELVCLMVEKGSNLAKGEFYYRYSSFLLRVCRKACSNFDSGNSLAEDIFQNTMQEGIENIEAIYKNSSQNTTNLDNQIKRWLSRIAHNEFISFLRRNKDEKLLAASERVKSDEVEVEFDLGEDPKDPVENSQFGHLDPEKILGVLSDRERYILMVYYSYFDPDNPNRHLPDNEIEKLCTMFDISSAYLRKIKSRALKKLRTANSKLIEKFS